MSMLGRLLKRSPTHFLDIRYVEVKWAGCMENNFEWRIRDDRFIKGPFLCDVWHDSESELPLVGKALIRVPNLVRLLLRADSGDD